jgi:hypothetical protein
MESKTVKGIVELVNPAYNSVKLKDGETYSGKFSYKGSLPNIGDEVELILQSTVSKKDQKTYWNITGIAIIKSMPQEVAKAQSSDKEKSIIAQCLTKIVFGEKGADAQLVFDTYQNFLTKL